MSFIIWTCATQDDRDLYEDGTVISHHDSLRDVAMLNLPRLLTPAFHNPAVLTPLLDELVAETVDADDVGRGTWLTTWGEGEVYYTYTLHDKVIIEVVGTEMQVSG